MPTLYRELMTGTHVSVDDEVTPIASLPLTPFPSSTVHALVSVAVVGLEGSVYGAYYLRAVLTVNAAETPVVTLRDQTNVDPAIESTPSLAAELAVSEGSLVVDIRGPVAEVCTWGVSGTVTIIQQ